MTDPDQPALSRPSRHFAPSAIRTRFADLVVPRLFPAQLERARLTAASERDGYWIQLLGSAGGPQDRPWAELQLGLEDALDAWRTNPLAKRYVDLVTDFVVGSGISLYSDHEAVNRFLQAWMRHPKNALIGAEDEPGWRIYQLCDELTRAGELFITLHTNPGDGMTYIRPIPARQIQHIDTDPDDYEHELTAYQVLPSGLPHSRGGSEGGSPISANLSR